jgi:thioredoxin reductase (NADPH)
MLWAPLVLGVMRTAPSKDLRDKASLEASLDPQAFPRLRPAQIRELESFGQYKNIPKGESVWEAGTSDVCMFVVVKGSMSIKDGQNGIEVARHPAGSFSGDIDVITRRPSIVSAYARTDLKVLVVAGDCVRAIINERPLIGDIILGAFLRRRELLQGRGDVGVRVIGSRYSAETLKIREFLSRSRYPQSWDDLEEQEDVHAFLQEMDVEESETPVVILPSGKLLRAPNTVDLGHELGLTPVPDNVIYDLVVVGSGPAGLAAAVYGASEGLNTLVLDEDVPGGQAGTSSRIENYMGFPLGLSGQQLADSAVSQAEKFGARMVSPACVQSMKCEQDGVHSLTVDMIGEVVARCVILAPGASYRKLEVDDLERFENVGVYYSATFMEQGYCADDVAIVVGGGNSAGQAAIFMSQKARHVILVVRSNDLRKGMSTYLARRIETSDRIEVRLNSEICSLAGDTRLRSVTIADKQAGTYEDVPAAGVFVMIGATPHTDWLPPQVAKDKKGFILTGQDVAASGRWKASRPPFFLETSCPGVFAAGDARSGSVKRVASAVGEGSMAVAFIHEFLSL